MQRDNNFRLVMFYLFFKKFITKVKLLLHFYYNPFLLSFMAKADCIHNAIAHRELFKIQYISAMYFSMNEYVHILELSSEFSSLLFHFPLFLETMISRFDEQG